MMKCFSQNDLHQGVLDMGLMQGVQGLIALHVGYSRTVSPLHGGLCCREQRNAS